MQLSTIKDGLSERIGERVWRQSLHRFVVRSGASRRYGYESVEAEDPFTGIVGPREASESRMVYVTVWVSSTIYISGCSAIVGGDRIESIVIKPCRSCVGYVYKPYTPPNAGSCGAPRTSQTRSKTFIRFNISFPPNLHSHLA